MFSQILSHIKEYVIVRRRKEEEEEKGEEEGGREETHTRHANFMPA